MLSAQIIWLTLLFKTARDTKLIKHFEDVERVLNVQKLKTQMLLLILEVTMELLKSVLKTKDKNNKP